MVKASQHGESGSSFGSKPTSPVILCANDLIQTVLPGETTVIVLQSEFPSLTSGSTCFLFVISLLLDTAAPSG